MEDEDPDSFLLQAISPVYQKCSSVKGTPPTIAVSNMRIIPDVRQ